MTEYLMRFRFAHIDDHHAQHLAAAIAGGTVAEWDGNGLVWEGVERADGRPFQPEPAPEVDPVLISAAWGGAARPVVSDEDMERVITRIAAVLQARDAPDDPGTEAVSPQASSGVPEWLRHWDLSIPDHRRVHAEQRPVRPTASEITDDQLDALHAALDRVRQLADAISGGRALTASLDDIADRIRQAIDGTTPAWEPRLSHEDLRGGFAPGLTGGLCSVCHIARVLGGWSASLGAGTGNDAALDESDDATQGRQ